MIKWMTRAVSLLLAVLLSCLTVACSTPSTDDSKNPPPSAGNDETPGENDPDIPTDDEPQSYEPQIPQTVVGNGQPIVIQSEGWFNFDPLAVADIGIQERTGAALNDAAFGRDRQIEEMLDVLIEARHYGHQTDSLGQLSVLVNSGSCDIDFYLIRSAHFTGATSAHLLSPIDRPSLTYFDVDAPYWDRASYDALSVANTHYGLTGDFTVADDSTYWCVYFNKQLQNDYSLQSPYQLVEDGEWTYEKMYELAEEVAADLDDTEGPSDGDQYGISLIRDILPGALNTCGVMLMEKNASDIPELTFYQDQNVTALLDLLEIFYDKDVVYNTHAEGGDDIQMFLDGNILFTMGGIFNAPQMRLAEMDFGILPLPKYQESQSHISVTSSLSLSILALPQSVTTDDTLKSAFMELYSYLGSEQVVPEYHNRLLKYLISRDEDSRQMLDEIFDHTVYDVGNLFNFGGISLAICDMMLSYKDNVASMWAGKEGLIESDLQALLDALEQ